VKGGRAFDEAAEIAHAGLSVAAKIPEVLEKIHDGPGGGTAIRLIILRSPLPAVAEVA